MACITSKSERRGLILDTNTLQIVLEWEAEWLAGQVREAESQVRAIRAKQRRSKSKVTRARLQGAINGIRAMAGGLAGRRDALLAQARGR